MEMKTKFSLISALMLTAATTAGASEIAMNTAQMQAMDKITGRVNIIEVPVGGEIKFGSFSIVVRSCKTRPEEEIPENFAFVDVTDKSFDQEEFNIFKGWMFSSQPAVNAVEHPIYDVWLLKCINSEVSTAKLLSTAQLEARDRLPRLQDIRLEQQALKENSFEKARNNIEIKDSMYKEQSPRVKQPSTDTVKSEGEPENLLNIDESYEAMEEENISLPAEELAAALDDESRKLRQNDVPESPESGIDAELSAAIDAELAKSNQ